MVIDDLIFGAHGVYGLLLFVRIAAVFSARIITRGSSTAMDIPLPDDEAIIPEHARHLVDELEKMGFEYLSATRTVHQNSDFSGTSWQFSNPLDTTIIAFVGADPPAVAFETAWHDNAVVETMFLPGTSAGKGVNTDNHIALHLTESVQDTYEKHMEVLAEFRLMHGKAREFRSITDVVEWQQIYRPLHAENLLRTTVQKLEYGALMTAVALGWLVATTIMIAQGVAVPLLVTWGLVGVYPLVRAFTA